jgi:two-component system response regulator FixJ
MLCTTVFVVSDDAAIRDSLAELTASAGLRAEAFPSLDAWLDTVGTDRQGCLALDVRARDFVGAEEFSRLAAFCARRPVLLLIDRGDVPMAVRAIKGGAVDVVEKPYRNADLIERIKRAATARREA